MRGCFRSHFGYELNRVRNLDLYLSDNIPNPSLRRRSSPNLTLRELILGTYLSKVLSPFETELPSGYPCLFAILTNDASMSQLEETGSLLMRFRTSMFTTPNSDAEATTKSLSRSIDGGDINADISAWAGYYS